MNLRDIDEKKRIVAVKTDTIYFAPMSSMMKLILDFSVKWHAAVCQFNDVDRNINLNRSDSAGSIIPRYSHFILKIHIDLMDEKKNENIELAAGNILIC